MTDIPWDEMPEGATHYDPEDSIRPWMKLEVDGWSTWENNEWNFFGFDDGWVENGGESRCIPVPKRPSIPQWHGPEDGVPQIETLWKHRNGQQYRVIAHANKYTENPEKYPVMVIYEGTNNGKVWARAANDWHRSMTPLPTKRDQWAEKAERYFDKGDGTYQSVVRAIHDALISGELPVPESDR